MRGFDLIVLAGLGSAALGGGLGWLVGCLSLEFLGLVAQPSPAAEPGRLGAAFGVVSGLLLGALVMAFGLLVDAARARAARGRPGAAVPPDGAPRQGGHAAGDREGFMARSGGSGR
jgi:hypothetical protein